MSTSFTNSTALLGHRSFVRFWIARLTGGFANQMQSVAVGWQVYALTGSALDLGLVGLAQFLPSVVLLLVVGHVAGQLVPARQDHPVAGDLGDLGVQVHVHATAAQFLQCVALKLRVERRQ